MLRNTKHHPRVDVDQMVAPPLRECELLPRPINPLHAVLPTTTAAGGGGSSVPPSPAPSSSAARRTAGAETDAMSTIVAGPTAGLSLGNREPCDGRYTSLVRSTFTHAAPKKPAGEPLREVPTREQVLHAKKEIEDEMHARHFFLGTPDPLQSEHRAMLRPPPTEALVNNAAAKNRETALAMTSCSVFHPAKGGVYEGGTTTRADFVRHGAQEAMRQKLEAAALRRAQQQSHWVPGGGGETAGAAAAAGVSSRYALGATSENRACFKGEQPAERAKPTFSSVALTIAPTAVAADGTASAAAAVAVGPAVLAAGGADPHEPMRSLKQVDFVPHVEACREARRVAERPPKLATVDSLVLGSHHVPARSLYQVSFTPTMFVPPRK